MRCFVFTANYFSYSGTRRKLNMFETLQRKLYPFIANFDMQCAKLHLCLLMCCKTMPTAAAKSNSFPSVRIYSFVNCLWPGFVAG